MLLADEEISIFGDGSQLRDFNYVDDAVDAFLLAAPRDEATGQVYNLGGDGHVSLLELAETLIRVAGSGRYPAVPFPDDRKAIDIGDYYADYSAIGASSAGARSVPLAEGLARTLEYYREHGDAYRDVTSERRVPRPRARDGVAARRAGCRDRARARRAAATSSAEGRPLRVALRRPLRRLARCRRRLRNGRDHDRAAARPASAPATR